MLISSKNRNEKIVLGLLSYTYPSEEHPSIETQRQLLEAYQVTENADIYLYKTDESENYIGLVCVEISQVNQSSQDESMTLILDRVALNPSFREEGLGFEMYKELRDLYPQATVIGSNLTMEIVAKWTEKYQNESLPGGK